MAKVADKRRADGVPSGGLTVTRFRAVRKYRHECGRNFRAVVVDCPKYLSKRSEKEDEAAGNGEIP